MSVKGQTGTEWPFELWVLHTVGAPASTHEGSILPPALGCPQHPTLGASSLYFLDLKIASMLTTVLEVVLFNLN